MMEFEVDRAESRDTELLISAYIGKAHLDYARLASSGSSGVERHGEIDSRIELD